MSASKLGTMRSATLVIMLVCACCALDAPLPPHEQPAGLTSPDDDICEAVFRYQFEESQSQMSNAISFRFLEFEDRQDPPAEFLARFRDSAVPVAPASMSIVVPDDHNRIDEVRHRSQQGNGRIFWVGRPRSIADQAYEVGGGYYQGRLASSGHTYRVERRGAAWVVTDDVMLWIS